MEALGWRRRRESSPAARRGARQRARLTPASASNTISCKRETLQFIKNDRADQKTQPIKNPLTMITVSTAIFDAPGANSAARRWRPFRSLARSPGPAEGVHSETWTIRTIWLMFEGSH